MDWLCPPPCQASVSPSVEWTQGSQLSPARSEFWLPLSGGHPCPHFAPRPSFCMGLPTVSPQAYPGHLVTEPTGSPVAVVGRDSLLAVAFEGLPEPPSHLSQLTPTPHPRQAPGPAAHQPPARPLLQLGFLIFLLPSLAHSPGSHNATFPSKPAGLRLPSVPALVPKGTGLIAGMALPSPPARAG